MSIDRVLKLFMKDASVRSSSPNFYLMQLVIQSYNEDENDPVARNKIIEMRDASTEQADIDFFQSLIDASDAIRHSINVTRGVIDPDNGETGPQGETGLRGYKGFEGIQGETGVGGLERKGETGIQGDEGVTGVGGSTGFGIKGSTGPDGDKGFDGAVGERGIDGEKGLPGEQGIQGIQGETGIGGIGDLQGDTGIQGETGFPGAGTTGVKGILGIPGPQGDTGVPGLGDTGVQGITGVQGPPGIKGIDGEVPPSIQGITGAQGIQGITGFSGAETGEFVIIPNGGTVPTLVTGDLYLEGNASLIGNTVVKGSITFATRDTTAVKLTGNYTLLVLGNVYGDMSGYRPNYSDPLEYPLIENTGSVEIRGGVYGVSIETNRFSASITLGSFQNPKAVFLQDTDDPLANIITNSLNPGDITIYGDVSANKILSTSDPTPTPNTYDGGNITFHGNVKAKEVRTFGSVGDGVAGGNGGEITCYGYIDGAIVSSAGSAGTPNGSAGNIYIKNGARGGFAGNIIEVEGSCHIGGSGQITSPANSTKDTLLYLRDFSGILYSPGGDPVQTGSFSSSDLRVFKSSKGSAWCYLDNTASFRKYATWKDYYE